MTYSVVEKFISINGEGQKAGELAVFIRLSGCNLECSYCDTTWANAPDVHGEELSANDILDYIRTSGIHNVTLTGGEPLLHSHIKDLINTLIEDDTLFLEIETNGSVSLNGLRDDSMSKLSFTMDYKLESSLMISHMQLSNFEQLSSQDTIKFVVGSIIDLNIAKQLIDTYLLTKRCHIYFSPVFGLLDPKDIVEFMTHNTLNGVRLQLQLHKIIWDPSLKGV